MPPDEPNAEEALEEEPEDNETPFRPADDATYQDDQAQASVKPLQPADAVDDAVLADDEDDMQPDVGDLSSTHPQTDTNMQAGEWYDEGISGAAEAGEPNAENTVVGYKPPTSNQRTSDPK